MCVFMDRETVLIRVRVGSNKATAFSNRPGQKVIVIVEDDSAEALPAYPVVVIAKDEWADDAPAEVLRRVIDKLPREQVIEWFKGVPTSLIDEEELLHQNRLAESGGQRVLAR